jgi:hypothetical protein
MAKTRDMSKLSYRELVHLEQMAGSHAERLAAKLEQLRRLAAHRAA